MSTLPIHLGDEAQFRLVREFLDVCGYTESAAADRMGLQRLDHLTTYHMYDHAKRERNLLIRDPLGVVVNLFLRGQEVEPSEVEEFVPEPVRSAMQALGLLENQSGRLVSPVLLYPSHGVYLTSDRYMNADQSEIAPGNDFVYLALHQSTTDFIQSTPASPCKTFLDVGAGCGIAALGAAKNFA
jgi:hypothetical protein